MIRYHYFSNVSITTNNNTDIIHKGYIDIANIFSDYTTYLGFSITCLKDTVWGDQLGWTESYINYEIDAKFIIVFSWLTNWTFLLDGYILYL